MHRVLVRIADYGHVLTCAVLDWRGSSGRSDLRSLGVDENAQMRRHLPYIADNLAQAIGCGVCGIHTYYIYSGFIKVFNKFDPASEITYRGYYLCLFHNSNDVLYLIARLLNRVLGIPLFPEQVSSTGIILWNLPYLHENDVQIYDFSVKGPNKTPKLGDILRKPPHFFQNVLFFQILVVLLQLQCGDCNLAVRLD